MRWLLILCSLLVALPAFSQKGAVRIDGVLEPPELTGEPKKVTKPTEADTQLFEIIGHLTDENQTKSNLPKLDEFITLHPEYSDAYFLRATCEACILNSRNFASISSDVKAAISHPGQVYNKTDYYSLLGKIEFAKANYAQAVDDLEKAMTRQLDTANRMFNIAGIEPEKTSQFCTWNLTDLDELVARFPKDYRAWLFRGLYYEFFTTIKEDYYPKAMQEFRKAALLNLTSPLPQYFIGRLYTKTSYWTKKAWASEASRDEATKSAVEAYTKAIQLDQKFLPAYLERASGYLNLKQYPQAIKDYDRILELDPENATAYSDRGVAKLQSAHYTSAIVDFDEAIRHKGEDDSFLSSLHEYTGDADVAAGNYRDAIRDYSKAIERTLANETFLLNVRQFRALYPEYDSVSDEVLLRKLHALFWPQFEYDVFAKQIENNGERDVTFLLSNLYEKRGDAYLKAGDYRRGTLDFNRIFNGVPNMASSTDRWRMLGATGDGDTYYLDVKTVEFAAGDLLRLWIKTVGKKHSETIAWEINCKARLMNNASTVVYDSSGSVLSSSELAGGWQRIVPDTIGEQIFNGACSSAH